LNEPRPGSYNGWVGTLVCPTCGLDVLAEVVPIKEGPILVGTEWYCPACDTMTVVFYDSEEES
jgi:rubredoxin